MTDWLLPLMALAAGWITGWLAGAARGYSAGLRDQREAAEDWDIQMNENLRAFLRAKGWLK